MCPVLRPAIAPGEDRNQSVAGIIRSPPEAAPGHRAGRGSQRQPEPTAVAPCGPLRPAIAPGEDRNRSLDDVSRRQAVSCARPSRRARIATATSARTGTAGLSCARPSRRARIATTAKGLLMLGMTVSCARPSRRARIATTRGPRTATIRRAAPGHRAGRGSQPPSCSCCAACPCSCARPSRRARIATTRSATRPKPPRWCCARPSRRARIATDPQHHHHLDGPAAPGHRAGRGSQREARLVHEADHLVLRPAIAPGEDRNVIEVDVPDDTPAELRPAIAPGEDRNRPGSASRPSRSQGCARPSRRARIATRGQARTR